MTTSNPFAELRVLIVEDNAVDREMLKTHLQQIGIAQIQEARQGHEGVFKLENLQTMGKHFDLLITDWRMPQMDGMQLLRHLKKDKQFRKTRIMMLTSVAEEPFVLQALREGVDDFIIKPIDHDVLKRKIAKLMGLAAA